MNTVGVGAGSNLQFYNMVIPDMNGDSDRCATPPASRCTPADPAAFYNTPAQMAELANKVGGTDLDGSLPIERVPDESRAPTSLGLLSLDIGISL